MSHPPTSENVHVSLVYRYEPNRPGLNQQRPVERHHERPSLPGSSRKFTTGMKSRSEETNTATSYAERKHRTASSGKVVVYLDDFGVTCQGRRHRPIGTTTFPLGTARPGTVGSRNPQDVPLAGAPAARSRLYPFPGHIPGRNYRRAAAAAYGRPRSSHSGQSNRSGSLNQFAHRPN